MLFVHFLKYSTLQLNKLIGHEQSEQCVVAAVNRNIQRDQLPKHNASVRDCNRFADATTDENDKQ